jgi:hypothetical protein
MRKREPQKITVGEMWEIDRIALDVDELLIDLTLEQAQDLFRQLERAIDTFCTIEDDLEEYMKGGR